MIGPCSDTNVREEMSALKPSRMTAKEAIIAKAVAQQAATNATACVVCGPGHYTAQAAARLSSVPLLMEGSVHSLDVRLSESNQLQMNVDSRGWAAVCDDGFGEDEAVATCRSLGFGRSA